MKTLGQLVILLAMAGWAVAGPVAAPEIDGSSAVSVFALVSGGLLILRGRRKQ